MGRLALRILLIAGLLVDFLFILAGISLIIHPEGQTSSAGVALILILFVAIAVALVFGIKATFKKNGSTDKPSTPMVSPAPAENAPHDPAVFDAVKTLADPTNASPMTQSEPQSNMRFMPAPDSSVPSAPEMPVAPTVAPAGTPSRAESYATPPASPLRNHFHSLTQSMKQASRTPANRGHMKGREWVPPLPTNVALEPWGRCHDVIDVVGENYRKGVFSQIMGREPGFHTEQGATITDPATLVFDGENPFSKSHLAIAVYIRGAHVGYIPEDLTRVWGVALRDLSNEGFDLRVKARTWARADGYGEHAAVTVYLPAADALRPSNGLPDAPHVIIPAGRKRQVSGEENHMDALSPFIVPGGTNHVSVVLRSITEVRPRSTAELVQVELGGKRVGRLTDVQSKNLLPLVKYIEARGKLPVARADIIGTTLKADVVIMCADASEVDHAWLESLGPEIKKPTEVIPGPDWDWDDDPEPVDEAVLRVRREREVREARQGRASAEEESQDPGDYE